MTTIKITTSMSTTTISVPSPVDETFEIRYHDCLYCGTAFRKHSHQQKFHSDSCRFLYHHKGIADFETQPRYSEVLFTGQ